MLKNTQPTTEGFLAVIQPPRFPSSSKPPPDRSSLVAFAEYRRRFGEAAVASLAANTGADSS